MNECNKDLMNHTKNIKKSAEYLAILSWSKSGSFCVQPEMDKLLKCAQTRKKPISVKPQILGDIL